jgi:hypothetical protein
MGSTIDLGNPGEFANTLAAALVAALKADEAIPEATELLRMLGIGSDGNPARRVGNPLLTTDLAEAPTATSGVSTLVGVKDGAILTTPADPLMALSISDSAQSLATRSARLNLGLNGGGAVLAVGRNANNAGANYSGHQFGGGYVDGSGVYIDGQDGVYAAPDGQASWLRFQPTKNLSPIEFLIYSTMASGFGSVVLGGNQITYVSGTAFASFAVGKKIYFDETVYLISGNTGTVITVTTTAGGAVSFGATATKVFHYGYISGSGTCSISGTAVTRIAGDPFLPFYTVSSFVFKTSGTARTVAGYTDPEHYTLSVGPGNTSNTSYSFEVDINDMISCFRVQKMVGGSEENLSIFARYDGYWITAQYAGSGEYRKIVLSSGEYTGANPYRQIVIQKNGDITFGGDYGRDAIRVLTPSGITPANRWEVVASPTGFGVVWRTRGSDANVPGSIDLQGTGKFSLTGGSFDHTLAEFIHSATDKNYFHFISAPNGTDLTIRAKAGGTDTSRAIIIDGLGTTGKALRVTNNLSATELFSVSHDRLKSVLLAAYADDVAAAAGGIAVGEWFHSTTSGAIRQRRS